MRAHPRQGPPGTGKTRTILGLLSVILHAAPPDSAGLGSHAHDPEPAPQLMPDDLHRLWRLASPWLNGGPCYRRACPTGNL